MTDPDGDRRSQLERWVGVATSVVAPVTVLGALLFYFGYVSSRAQYDYFGVDVDVIGLSTQDYVMRSPQPLLVPLLALTLLGAALLALHTTVRRRVAAHEVERPARIGTTVGVALLGIGVCLLFGYPLLSGWTFYPLVTPLLLAVAGALTAYSLATLRWLDTHRAADPQPRTFARPGVVAMLWVAVAACVFWATATVAQWSGNGLAREQARNLDELPSVVLDTKERLFLPARAGVEERALEPREGTADFRYRYFRLRLLVQGDDRMFVVPERWSPFDTTLVVPLDADVRVQFQFRNIAP